jgi:hypothetical protein
MHIIQILVHTKHSHVIVNQKSRKEQMSFQSGKVNILCFFIRTLPRIDSDDIALVVDVGLGIPQVLDLLNLKFVRFLELILKMLLRRLGLHLTWVKGS